MKKGFTLMEVTLAIGIMAFGILSIVSLYSFGYRESRQSREDVASAAYAEAVLSPLVMACSATNLKWSVFKDIESYPDETGWAAYVDVNSGQVKKGVKSTAQGVFQKLAGVVNSSVSSMPDIGEDGLIPALVVIHAENSPIIKLGFRATTMESTMLAMPMYYVEVHFQGRPDL